MHGDKDIERDSQIMQVILIFFLMEHTVKVWDLIESIFNSLKKSYGLVVRDAGASRRF